MRESHDKQPVLLAIGDAIAPTGFARVMHNILGNLTDDFDIHQIGINYHGDPHNKLWKIYPAKNGGDLRGVGRVAQKVEELHPELIFLLNDIWVLVDYVCEIRKTGHDCPIIAYCPIDAGPVDEEMLLKLEGVAQFVVYTQFAANEVAIALAKIRSWKPDFIFPEVKVIAHGVDTDMFYPLKRKPDNSVDRQFATKLIYGDDPEMKDTFIVLNANRNQPRKRIDITIKGFAKFAKGKPDNVKLHLHMGIQDAGWNVIKLAKRFGIYDRLILTSDSNNLPGVSDGELNRIYNSASVGINTSIGEGWGLVAFEHAAAGGVQIVPNHTACKELWHEHGLLLDVTETIVTEGLLTEGYLVSSDHLAAQLEFLYTHPEELNRLSFNGIVYAKQQSFQWPTIASEWKLLFEEELNLLETVEASLEQCL